jgi:hypothetical protein
MSRYTAVVFTTILIHKNMKKSTDMVTLLVFPLENHNTHISDINIINSCKCTIRISLPSYFTSFVGNQSAILAYMLRQRFSYCYYRFCNDSYVPHSDLGNLVSQESVWNCIIPTIYSETICIHIMQRLLHKTSCERGRPAAGKR